MCKPMLIAIFAIFCPGIGNFAMHRAFMESDDPLVRQMVRPLADQVGPHVTYVFEFMLLLGALTIATRHWFIGLFSHGIYNIFNPLAVGVFKIGRPTCWARPC